MQVIYHRLIRRIAWSEQRFRAVTAAKSSSSQDDNWARTESLINHTWQSWCLFCRQLIMASALGGKTRSGVALPACVVPSDWERVSYMAICAASGNAAKAGRTNNALRKEPTWGNPDKLVDIATAVATPNLTTIQSAITIASRCTKHMQAVRNCTAHMCGETFDLVKAMRPYYNVTSLRHPCDAAFWIDPSNGLHAFVSWLEDMRQAARDGTL